MRKYKWFILSFMMISLGCEKQVDWDLDNKQHQSLVVEGLITNQMKAHSIKLTKPVTELNQEPEPVLGGNVYLSDGDSTWILEESADSNGVYFTMDNYIGVTGKVYALLIELEGEIYTAHCKMLPGKSFDPAQYKYNEVTGKCYLTWIAPNYDAEHYAMYEVNLDWSGVPGYEDIDPDSCRARILHYTLPTIDVSQVFHPSLERITFPVGTIVTESRYTLTREHIDFIRALLSETNWQGGLFDSSHSSLPTNLSSGACGFFAACGVESLSFIVTAN